MLEREVIGTCLFVWADRNNMTSSDAKRWKLSRKGWYKSVKKTTIFTINFTNVPEKTPEKK